MIWKLISDIKPIQWLESGMMLLLYLILEPGSGAWALLVFPVCLFLELSNYSRGLDKGSQIATEVADKTMSEMVKDFDAKLHAYHKTLEAYRRHVPLWTPPEHEGE